MAFKEKEMIYIMHMVKKSTVVLFLAACFAAGVLSYMILNYGVGKYTAGSTKITETVTIEDVPASESTLLEDRVLEDYWTLLLIYNYEYGTEYTDSDDETVFIVTNGKYKTYDEWAAMEAEKIKSNYGITILQTSRQSNP